MNNKNLIQKCLQEDRSAQKLLFEMYKTKVMSICLRYARMKADAEDILQEAFVQIFRKLSQLSKPEALGSWISQISIRTAINYYRKNTKYRETFDFQLSIEDQYHLSSKEDKLIVGTLEHEQLLKMIQALPFGPRMVFNMFVIEGYSHKEIALELGTTELSSRVQLNKARKILKKRIQSQEYKSDTDYGQQSNR